MKIFSTHCFFLFTCILPLTIFAQEDSSGAYASIDKYTLKVEIGVEHQNIQAEAQIRLHLLKDSVSRVRFTVARSMSEIYVHDIDDKKIEIAEESSPSDSLHKDVSVPLSDTLKHGDTLFLKIFYEESYDSILTHASFINPKEILLSANDNVLWWPVLSPATNPLSNQTATVALDVTLPSTFTVVSNGDPDSTSTHDSRIVHGFTYKNPMDLKSCFIVCASSALTQASITSADSTFQ
ncbi:MAG: hypothetical protein WBZ48_12730, partial [Bacteroidota bacterium]